MDIRKFLVSKAAPAPKKRVIVDDDDDDVIPASPDVQVNNNKKKKTKSDSYASKSKSSKPALKEVKPLDLFGKGPIKRTDPIVKKETKNTETGIHSDDEFDKSLLEIDSFDDIETKNTQKDIKKEKSSSINREKSPNIKREKSPNIKREKSPNIKREKSPKASLDKKSKTKSPETTVKEDKNRKDKHSLSLNKEKKSTDKSAIDKRQAIDNLKKEIRDTNKRKFEEFIENTEVISDGEGKKKKLENANDKKKLENGNHSKQLDERELQDMSINDSMVDEEDSGNKTKKKRANKSLNESVLTDEERHERKQYSAALYQKYLNRSGPKHLGAKEIPEGAENCLKDCAFLLTGVLDSFERDEVVDTIKKYGGTIKSGISKKVTHVLAGDEAGPAKMAKAQELGIKIINEDEFLQIIKDSNKKTESKHKSQHKSDKDKHSDKKSSKEKLVNGSKEIKQEKRDKSKEKLDVKSRETSKSPANEKAKERERDSKRLNVKEEKREKSTSPKKNDIVKLESMKTESTVSTSSSAKSYQSIDVKVDTKNANSAMWVEKYKPQNLKQIIGQHGEASNVNKLMNWLTKWYVNRKAKLPKPSPWAKNDDGGYYKAALLSGPPGVGKTTTVSLVCKELGFDVVEFNASDTRSKTLIREQIGELLTTTSLSGYARGCTGKQAVTKKHVLVMDEVDGMAGNEDRGGLQELIGLIKSASVPIICMCNDRNSQKMRSLVNYCYDLRFSRPRVDQIKAALRSICCKENIKIPPEALGQLIEAAGRDVRQALTRLSLWAADPARMDAHSLARDAKGTKNDVKLGPWEAIRKVFSAEEHKTMSLNDKSDLFFYDYSLAPLFVQENYLQVQPHCPKHEVLERISKAADSIAFGDVVEAKIRGSQMWSLLPVQAMYSSVFPGHYLSGHITGQIQFPGWLGKNSRKNKMHRLCQEIHAHTRLSTTGSKSSIYLDYASHLRDAIYTPLIKQRSDGIDQSLTVLESYHLLREDLDSLTELSLWPAQRNPAVLVDSKVKAAMTRQYNKQATALPYAPGAIKKGRAKDEETLDDEEQVDDEQADDSDPENDALIKKKKAKEPSKAASEKPSCSKGKSSKGKKK